MINTVEAVIDEQGNVRLLEPIHLPSSRRALVMILEDRPTAGVPKECVAERGRARGGLEPSRHRLITVIAPYHRVGSGNFAQQFLMRPGDKLGVDASSSSRHGSCRASGSPRSRPAGISRQTDLPRAI